MDKALGERFRRKSTFYRRARLYFGGAVGGDRDHRRAGGLAAAGHSVAHRSAGRSSCSNNLRQIGLALTNHVSAKTFFPPGQQVTCTSCDPWAWSMVVLPFMEQSEIYNLCNLAKAPNDPTFSTSPTNPSYNATTRVIPTYLCPTVSNPTDPSRNEDGTLNNFYGQTKTKSGQYMAASDYAGIEGPNTSDINPANGRAYVTNQGVLPKLTTTGTISTSQAIRPREISDGMSRTMIVGEMAGRGFNAKSSKLKISGTWADGFNTANVNLAFSGPPSSGPPFGQGALPNSTIYANWCPAFASDELISYHSGGGFILMCDGSVHFIAQTVSASILEQLASRNGAEVIPDDWDAD